jgi:hypothetical protein
MRLPNANCTAGVRRLPCLRRAPGPPQRSALECIGPGRCNTVGRIVLARVDRLTTRQALLHRPSKPRPCRKREYNALQQVVLRCNVLFTFTKLQPGRSVLPAVPVTGACALLHQCGRRVPDRAHSGVLVIAAMRCLGTQRAEQCCAHRARSAAFSKC